MKCPSCNGTGKIKPEAVAVDVDGRCVRVGWMPDEVVWLTHHQVRALHIMVRRFGCPVPHETMIAAVYPDNNEPDDVKSTLKVHMTHLRKRIASLQLFIKVEHGVGYYVTRVRDPKEVASEVGRVIMESLGV